MTDTTLERSLRTGWYLAHQGAIYRISAFHAGSLELEVVHEASGESSRLSLVALLADHPETLYFAPSLDMLHKDIQQAKPPVGLFEAHNTLPEGLLARDRYILTTVSNVEQQVNIEKRHALLQGQPFQRTPVLKQALARLDPPIALSTYYKYHHLYHENGGSESALAAALRRLSFHQTRMSRAQLHFLDTLILRYYKRQPPLRPQTLYRLAQSVLKRTSGRWLNPDQCVTEVPTILVEELLDPKLPVETLLNNPEKAVLLTTIQLPSRSWFYTYLRWFEQQPEAGKAVVTARYGVQKWEQEYLVFDTFVSRAALPLEYVFADHYLLDVFVVDEATRRERDRLWLTVLIDAYSRSVLGMALLYETPSIMSIQSALHHALWPKTSHMALGLTGDWLCYGIPQQLSLDNAWAHHSHSLEDLARMVSENGKYASIDLLFRPAYRGRYGALVERFFGNLAGQIRSFLPGALQSSQAQHVRQAAREACLLYQDVNRFLHQTVLHYQHTVHSELQGMTPHEKWLEGMQMGLPLVPPQTPEMDRAFWRLCPQTRVVSSKGVNAFGMVYGSPELSQAVRYDRHGQPVRYAFRYDPANISCLALFRDGSWVGDVYAHALRQPDGSWLPLSLAERKLAQRLARQAGDSPRDWLRYLHDLDELVQTRQKERRHARSTASVSARAPMDVGAAESAVQRLSRTAVYRDYTDLLVGFLDNPDGSERPWT
jgi:hypothetical protein